MPDMEKVIRWLEACSTGCEYGCPYEYEGTVVQYECKADLMRDALELLKEQEAVKTCKTLSGTGVWYRNCGACGGVLTIWAKYCPTCGRAVKWDD